MTVLKPAPEGQPTHSIKRFLDHAKDQLEDWEYERSTLLRQLARAERRVESEKSNVELYEYQLQLRREQGRFD